MHIDGTGDPSAGGVTFASPNNTNGTIWITSPRGSPGLVAAVPSKGNRRDIRFDNYGISLLTSNDASSPDLANGLIIRETGDIGIGTTGPNYKLEVIGTGRFSGFLTKSGGGFLIDHPNPALSDDYYLAHGFIEGEEHGVIYRGEDSLVNGAATVTLSDYFEYLVDEASITIQLTPKNGWSPLYVDGEVRGNEFIVRTTENGNQEQGFYWQVQGTRKDTFVLTDKHAQLMGTVLKSDWDESENE